MSEKIDYSKIWKLPDDLKKRVVKSKTPTSKKEGEISWYIAIALNRLPSHREMRAIAEQIHTSTKYEDLNPAITAYINASQEIKDKVCAGKMHILDLIKEEKIQELSEEDSKNIIRYRNAKEVQNKLSLFYKDLKFFLESSVEDREYLRKFLKAEKIHYIASLLSCIRDEKLLQSFIKHQGIKEEL